MKKIVFRADGNNNSGLGHLYRIFALIELLKDDFDYVLITKEDSTHKIIPATYKLRLIPESVLTDEEPEWLRVNYPPADHCIIADGYHFTSAYQEKIKKINYKLVYIDDTASEYMYADLVINHSPSAFSKKYSSEPYTRFALGTGFALVRPLFQEAAKRQREVRKMEIAFVCFGGADHYNFTMSVCRILVLNPYVKKINVVIGEAFRNSDIYGLAEQYEHIRIFKNISETDLVNVMKESEFAIVPTSTILFELCCVKMPILSGYYVDNQKDAYFAFLDEQAISGVGNFKEATDADLETQIKRLLGSDTDTMLKAQSRLFDGGQKQRLIKILNTL